MAATTPADELVTLNTPSGRLAGARVSAGFGSATQASIVCGFSKQGYLNHESGRRRISGQQACIYAKTFKTTPEWLLFGVPQHGPPTGPGTQHQRMREALEEIAAAHIPDQPAESCGDELAWAQRHVAALRLIAIHALTDPT